MLQSEISDLLAKQPFFAGLEPDELDALAQCGEVENFRIGINICKQGDPGDAAFLVYSGRLRVLQTSGSGEDVTIGLLRRGDFFGERAILTEEPRNATIRASEDAVVLRFPRQSFLAFLKERPSLVSYFEGLIEDRALVTFLRANTVFRSVPPKQIREAVEQFQPCRFQADETMIQQGDPGDSFYVIKSGEAKAVQRKNGELETLAFLGEGEFFGELALLTGEPRAASVIATKDTECLSLDRESFEAIIGRVPKLRDQLLQHIETYRLDPELTEKHALARESGRVQRQSLDYGTATSEEAEPSSPVPDPIRRKRGLWARYPWLKQNDETDCGATSLAMISRYYGKRLSIARLRDLANVNREGASMFSLAAAAEAIGYATRAVRTDYEHLAQLELPAIAHWKGYHYIVLYAADEKRVTVGDPAIGLLRMSRQEFEKGWTGRLLLLTPTAALLEQEEQRTTLRRFLPLLKPHHTLLLEVFLASLLINLFALATPFFTQNIVDRVLVHQDVQLLNIMLVGMLIVGVFMTLTVLLRRYLLIHISQKLSLRLSSDLFRQVMKLPMSYFAKRKVGDILTRFADNRKVQDLITSSAINTLLDVLMVIVYLTVMLAYNAKLTGVALIFIPLSVAITVIFTPIMKRNNQRLFERIAVAQSKLIESIGKIGAIKSSTAELPTRWRYEDMIVDRANQAFHGAKLGMVMDAASSAIQLLSTTVVLWFGAHLVINGEMTIGQLIAFNILIGMVMAPILGLVGMWQRLQDAFLSLQRLSDIYDADPEEQESAEASLVQLPSLVGEIKFENVSFRYSVDDNNVLSNITFSIEPGQTAALVGRSGSGKTTLISLLQRLHRPTEGRILVDGFDIAAVSARSLRAQMGVVLQDSAIFTGTIRENIAFGAPNVGIERIIAAARLANAHDFITSFPLGYDTVVGEIGISLSGGQRQRLCIARALLNEPRIILFDEATSSLDTESERAIQENMNSMLAGRTAIVIAHRLSTIRKADKIVVLDEGRIAEQGSHGELLTKRGLYFYLHSQQVGE